MLNDFYYIYLKEVESTNSEIKNLFNQLLFKKSIALLSDIQKKGRGRQNNIWISKPGDLTCSFLIYEKLKINLIGQINIVISASIVETLSLIFSDINIKIKWPNDIYIEEKKLGGILLESQITEGFIDYLIIGLGINIVSSPKISKYDTTKLSDYFEQVDPKKIFTIISKSILNSLEIWKSKGFSIFKKKWLTYSKDIGKSISIMKNKKLFYGKFININDYGEIVIKTEKSNLISFSYGEIY